MGREALKPQDDDYLPLEAVQPEAWRKSHWIEVDKVITKRHRQTHSNWCFWTVVLEETLESPLDYKDIN